MIGQTAPLTGILENRALLDSIVEQYGTPVYVYAADRIRENVRAVMEGLDQHLPAHQLYYAIKANQNLALLRVMQQAYPDMGVDCSTRGELSLALRAGLDSARLIYTGNYESYEDLEYALTTGLPINFDDVTSYQRCREIRMPESVSFRVNPGSGRGAYPGITTAGKGVKFGVPLDRVRDAYQQAINDGVEHFGIHTMVGSGILDGEYFAWNCDRILEIAEELQEDLGIDFEYVDLGGGFGIPYQEDESPMDTGELFAGVGEVVRRYYTPENSPLIAYELGRYLIGDAGFILARVLGTKENDTYFAGLDIGMNGLLRPALYDAYHRVVPLGEAAGRMHRQTEITGQICENTDRIARNRTLPELRTGDRVAILDTGAYGFCLANQYNGLPLPAEVLIDGEDHYLIRERESLDDLNRNVRIPDFLT